MLAPFKSSRHFIGWHVRPVQEDKGIDCEWLLRKQSDHKGSEKTTS
jgi:hypothetical protein